MKWVLIQVGQLCKGTIKCWDPVHLEADAQKLKGYFLVGKPTETLLQVVEGSMSINKL